MTDSYDNKFKDAVEQAVDQKLKGFSDSLNKQMSDQLLKDYANTWLKGSPLMLGGTQPGEIKSPAAQSYLVYKCVTVIANNFPQAPFILLNEQDEPIPNNHPLNVLLKRPNENMSGFDLWSATSTFYTLYGESFWYLNKSVGQVAGTSSMPAEILVLDPRKMQHIINPDLGVLNPNTGMLKGWIYDGRISLMPEEVLQFKNTNPYNIWRGLSPLDAADIEIKSDYKASVYQTRFFNNNAIPGMVLQTDKDDTSTISELRKLVRLWEQGHKGVDNAHKTGILRGGMKLEAVGLNQREMDFIKSRELTRDIVLSVFGVPKTLAGFTEGINRATADTQKRIFWQETLKPQMLRMQERLNSRFIETIAQGIHGVFDFSKIDELKTGMEDDVKASKELFGMGFSRNELNDRFGLGFEEVDSGDTKYVPMNLMDVEEEPIEPAPFPIVEEEEEEKQFNENKSPNRRQRQIFLRKQSRNERMMVGKVRKFFYTQRVKVLKMLIQKAELSTSELVSRVNIFEAEDERLITAITPVFQSIMQDAGEMALSFIGSEAGYEIDKTVLFNRVNKVKGINQTIFSQIKSEISKGVDAGETLTDISTRIKKVYKFADKRAMTIARTESSSLMSETSLSVYRTGGVQYKEWLTAGDGEVRPDHAGNQAQGAILLNRPFQNGEMYPGENSINCRCSISPVILGA